MRDPRHPAWPDQGERTELEEVASRWVWDYLDLVRQEHLERVTGTSRRRSKPLGRAVQEFIDARALTMSPATVANNRAVLMRLVDAVGASTPISRLTVQHAQSLIDGLLQAGYRPYTVHVYGLVLSSFWREIGRPGLAQQLTTPGRDRADVRVLTDAEIDACRTWADSHGPDSRLALELALGTGMRRGELIAAEWSDLREASRSLRVQRQRDARGRLRGLKGKRARTSLVLPSWWPFHDREARGRILTVVNTHRRWSAFTNAMFNAAGINQPGMGAHVFRHTYSRLFLEGGGSMEALRLSLGHSSIRTTEGTYGHLSDEAAISIAGARIYG